MTIAAGFLCSDGIVLAVDSEYSGNVSKSSGQKIFPIQQNNRFAVSLATAGHVGMAKRAVQKFTSLLNARIGTNPASLDDIQDVMEDALCGVHDKHIYPAPADERATVDFWVLMAVWTPSEQALFRTDITAVTRVYGADCIGIGSYLGTYLIDLLCDYSPLMSVEDVKPIAAYIIKSAKEFVSGCGLNTFLRVLTANGIDERVRKEEIIDGEECFDSLFRSMRHFLGGVLNASAPPVNIGALTESFKGPIGEFRNRQKARIDAIKAR
jgi:20S proteasome alpha/beta subunit